MLKTERAFSATDGIVDHHGGTEKVTVTYEVITADRLGVPALSVQVRPFCFYD